MRRFVHPWRRPEIVRRLATLLAGHPPAGDSPPDAGEVLILARYWHVVPALWLQIREPRDPATWPPGLVAQVRAAYYDNVVRNQRLRAELLRLAAAFAREGLEPLLLKGATHLVDPPGRNPARRILGDLDLLFRPGQAEAAQALLLRLGWILDPDTEPAPDDLHHLSRLVHPDQDLPIEVHRHPLHGSGEEWAHEFFEASVPAPDASIPVRLPCLHHRLLHNALHAFDNPDLLHWCSWESTTSEPALPHADLRQLLDFHDFSRMTPAPDWDALVEDARRLGRAADLGQWGHLAHDLLGTAVPPHLRKWSWMRPLVRSGSTLPRYLARQAATAAGLRTAGNGDLLPSTFPGSHARIPLST